MRLLILLAASTMLAQVPGQDSRNTIVPNTDTQFTMPVYKTRAEWEARAAKLRRQILFAAGLDPMPERTPLKPQIFGHLERHGYSIEKVLLETLPGYYVGGNLYRPMGKTGKSPGVLTPHGHWAYGRLENTAVNSVPARAINLAMQGFVVFTWDMTGYNDTIQTPHEFEGRREQLWGFGPLGLQLWNAIRAIDFMESLPDVDAQKLLMTGESGGGTQTFLTTAVDARIKMSAPVNMISSIMQGGAMCENAPGLRLGTNNMEIGAMMAPRPMLMVSATGDWTRNTPRVEYPAVRSIYELYDRVADLETIQIDAIHNYNQPSREAVYQFFGERMLGKNGDFSEARFQVEKPQDLLALHGRALPANALTFEQIFAQWIAAAKRQSEAVTDPKTLRQRLSLALASEWPAKVLSARDGERIVLSREGRGDRVPGRWVEGGREVTLVVDPEGAGAAGRAGSVLTIDAFQTGSAVAPRDRSVKHFLAFNQTDDACRVQDIVTALRFLQQSGYTNIKLAGVGRAAVWAQFAAAVAEIPVSLEANPGGFAGTDEDFLNSFFVPGIQRAGGLRAARAAAGGK